MKINIPFVSTNNTTIAGNTGYSSPVLISAAWTFTAVAEDIFLEGPKGNLIPFVLIPLGEGAVTVGLSAQPGVPFVITADEIAASKGMPLLYSIKKIYKTGTDLSSFTIGI